VKTGRTTHVLHPAPLASGTWRCWWCSHCRYPSLPEHFSSRHRWSAKI